MTTAVEAPEQATAPTVPDRVIDRVRQAAHLSHEAHLLKSMAADMAEDGAYAVKRAMKSARRRVERLYDLKHEAVYRVKREPLKAVGLAAGAGLALGLAVGWLSSRIARAHSRCSCE